MKCLDILSLLSLLVQGCLSESDSVSQNEGLSKIQFTGQALVDMGIKLNKPLLKLIGKTVSRVENQMKEDRSSFMIKDVVAEICRLHPCSEWSEWTNCDANNLGEFGGQTRNRNCGLNTTLCKHYAKPTVVRDSRICEYLCPINYTSTGHGFCLKLFTQKMARDDAEKVCQADGGHLVNVDSETKVKYVNETILQGAYPGDSLWMDGRRFKQGGSFTYGYNSTDPSFTFWGADDPDNGSNDLCVMYNKNSDTNNFFRWFDTTCSSKKPFICEFQ